jgi:hypothetical protein
MPQRLTCRSLVGETGFSDWEQEKKNMGDLANGHACDVFIYAFADDLVAKYRSPFLDETFGERVKYHVSADDNFQVGLYARMKTGHMVTANGEMLDEVEHFRLERMPLFAPTADDIAWAIAYHLDISEQEATQRLEKAEADMARKEREHQEEIEQQVAEEFDEGEEAEEER